MPMDFAAPALTVFDQIAGPIFVLMILGGLGVLVLFAYKTGILSRKPYKVIIRSPRSGGWKIHMAKGRFIKNGKFEVFYSLNDKVTTQAPDDKCILEGNILEGYSRSRDDIVWVDEMIFDDTKLTAEPAMNPAMKVSYATALKEEMERYTKPDPWAQYFPYASFLIGAFILGMFFYLAFNNLGANIASVANSMNTFNSNLANLDVQVTESQPEEESENILPTEVLGVPLG